MNDYAQLTDLLLRHREVGPLASLMLPQGASVLVLGAYKGDTIRLLRELYPQCFVFGYEPQLWAFRECHDRFTNDRNVIIRPYGLGAVNGTLQMYEYGTDACSFVELPHSRRQNIGEMRKADDELEHLGFESIDLAVVNIEGGEYKLLPYLEEHDRLRMINTWIIQWHHRPSYPAESEYAYSLLTKTHVLTWFHDSWTMWMRVP